MAARRKTARKQGADALEFLDAESSIWTANQLAWAREERRLFGQDPVLAELWQHKGEDAAQYAMRRNQAQYINYPELHAATLAGYLTQKGLEPNYGTLGTVRSREELAGQQPSWAELLHYNADGVGNDGSQWPALWYNMLMRALATSMRWLLLEMPALRDAATGDELDREPNGQDMLNGFRPFVQEWSPRVGRYHEHTNGRLDAFVARVPVLPDGAKAWQLKGDEDPGYYLFTRTDFTGFDDERAEGGWWLYDNEKNQLGHGTWARTQGQIPIAPLVGMPSDGTDDHPAMAKSLTMELGQFAVARMNLASMRDFDLVDAAWSEKYLLGAEPKAYGVMVKHKERGSRLIPVPGQQDKEGRLIVPTLWDGSTGAVVAAAFETALTANARDAREAMVRQVTAPDASGAAREIDFGTNTSPLLAGIAARLETAMNSMIHYAELRTGHPVPTGVATLPREFTLVPLLEKINRGFKRLTEAKLDSPTLTTEMVMQSSREDGLLPKLPADVAKVRTELLASGERQSMLVAGQIMQAMTGSGASLDGAAAVAGLTPAQLAKLEPAPPNPDDVPPGMPDLKQKPPTPPQIPPNAE